MPLDRIKYLPINQLWDMEFIPHQGDHILLSLAQWDTIWCGINLFILPQGNLSRSDWLMAIG